MSARHGKEAVEEGEKASDYPSARYFQVHFQHMHQQISGLEEQLRETSRQLAELQRLLRDAPPAQAPRSPPLIDPEQGRIRLERKRPPSARRKRL